MQAALLDREQYKHEASTRGMPPSQHSEQEKSQSGQHQEKDKQEKKQTKDLQGWHPHWGGGPSTIPADSIGALATNYSVAPGPAWVEMTNPVAIVVASGGTVEGDLPLWGAGEYLAKLQRPIGVVVVAPTTMPGTYQPNWVNQNLPPVPVPPPLSNTDQAELVANLWAPAQFVTQQAPLPVGPSVTGMSVQGFPGEPKPVSQASALPAALGVNGATIDNTKFPPEISVKFAGAGTIPANSRWLIFTITGV